MSCSLSSTQDGTTRAGRKTKENAISLHAKIINKNKSLTLSTHSEIQFGPTDAPDTLAAAKFLGVQCNIDLQEYVTEWHSKTKCWQKKTQFKLKMQITTTKEIMKLGIEKCVSNQRYGQRLEAVYSNLFNCCWNLQDWTNKYTKKLLKN
jgi:hypothetical protein